MGLMNLSKHRFIPKGRYFQTHMVPKTETDVRRERNVTLLVLIGMTILAIGIPILANLGHVIFGIEPIIY